jgi:cadmium resistance protein CadD (predicted permease)
MIQHILLAISTFVITNVDDLLIVTLFFANPAFKKHQIIVGQFIGISLLIGLSMLGLILGTVLAPHWISLFGLLPLLIGIKELGSNETDDDDELKEPEQKVRKNRVQWISIAIITIANGGDNLGVYVPLFANTATEYIFVYILTFLILTAVLCWISYFSVSHPVVQKIIRKYGEKGFAIFLIFLGIYIMSDFWRWIYGMI